MHYRFIGASFVALGAFACSGADPVDIGNNDAVKTGATLSDYAAEWDGYVEAYKFPSGSDRLRISLDAHGNGYVRFGDQPLWPPPTDPDVGYANTVELRSTWTNKPDEGFPYSVFQASVDDKRIRLGTQNEELFKEWCELQTPYYQSRQDVYTCMPEWDRATMPDPGNCLIQTSTGTVPVDCGKLTLCQTIDSPCSCTATGCTVPPLASLGRASTQLDAALEDGGDTLVGTLLLEDRVTVRLTRQ